MIVSAIAAIGEGGVIGRGGKLPWHLPDDLKRFRALTWGKPIIMGRKTFESIGRPLPGRTNIVLTRTSEFAAAGCAVASSPADALSIAASGGAEEAVIIGGAEVYRQLLPHCDRIHLTIVEADVDGDTFFPGGMPGPPDWDIVHEESHPADARHLFASRYRILARRAGTGSTMGQLGADPGPEA